MHFCLCIEDFGSTKLPNDFQAQSQTVAKALRGRSHRGSCPPRARLGVQPAPQSLSRVSVKDSSSLAAMLLRTFAFLAQVSSFLGPFV